MSELGSALLELRVVALTRIARRNGISVDEAMVKSLARWQSDASVLATLHRRHGFLARVFGWMN